jgi:hypothetical protein
MSVVKTNTNGFMVGDMYFNHGTNIDKVTADGLQWDTNWCVLTNSAWTNKDMGLNGGLCWDETGVFDHDLIVVTGVDDYRDPGQQAVWRVNSMGGSNLLATIEAHHLQNVITLPNTTNWGPWAGKILTGDKYSDVGKFYTIDTNGGVVSYASTNWFPEVIRPEDFDIIQTNQDLYLCDKTYNGGTGIAGAVMKLSSTLLTNYWGDLLVTQGDEVLGGYQSSIFILHWDGMEFNARRLQRIPLSGQFENATFGPTNIPSHPQSE